MILVFISSHRSHFTNVKYILQKSKIEECIDCITKTLQSIGDGRTAYDTAWIALIKDVINRDLPQFPSSLQWIASNQLCDGSWGDRNFFAPCDRLLSTLACVVALRTWNVHLNQSERGTFYKLSTDLVPRDTSQFF